MHRIALRTPALAAVAPTLTRILIKTCLSLALAVAASTAASAHAALDHAVPAAGSKIGAAPGQVVLYFTESIEAKFGGAEIRNASGAQVDKGSKASGNKITVDAGGLAEGTYTVKWHVLSVDTHKTQGSFRFTVGK